MGLDPSGIGESMTGMMSANMPNIAYWTGIFIASALAIGVLYFLYTFIQYKYTVTIFMRGGDGSKNNTHSIRQIKTVRGREFLDKGVERFGLLFSNLKFNPIPMKYIYPGNRIFLYQTGIKEFVPVKFECSNPEASFNPLPFNVRRWQNLELQEAFKDYQDQSFMQKYGGIFMLLGTAIVCAVLVGFVIWGTYKYIGTELSGAANAAKSLGDSLKEFGAQRFASQ